MKSTAITLDAAFVWCAATSPDGKVSYFGTGDQGRIYAVDAGSGGGRARAGRDAGGVVGHRAGGAPRRHADRGNDARRARLRGQTGPRGRADKAGKTGAKPFATLPAEHVWALALDNKTGTIYAATGGPGKVFAIDTAGKARPLWDSGDKHVVSLISAGDRHLYAGHVGGSDPLQGRPRRPRRGAGRLRRRGGARHRPSRHVRLRRGQRLRAIVVGRRPGGRRRHAARASRRPPSGSPSSAGSLPRPGQRKAKAALYRIDADGRMEQMFSIADGYFTTLAFDADGRAYVGTGSEGRVYRVAPDRTAALAIDVPERQALTLLPAGKGFLIGTGDVGGIYRAEPAAAKQASYLSRVLDGEFHARWGLFRWHGSHGLAVESRSGNTAKPDATWSGFARARAAARHGGGRRRPDREPARRATCSTG